MTSEGGKPNFANITGEQKDSQHIQLVGKGHNLHITEGN
jgi:hypothetical protein